MHFNKHDIMLAWTYALCHSLTKGPKDSYDKNHFRLKRLLMRSPSMSYITHMNENSKEIYENACRKLGF